MWLTIQCPGSRRGSSYVHVTDGKKAHTKQRDQLNAPSAQKPSVRKFDVGVVPKQGGTKLIKKSFTKPVKKK